MKNLSTPILIILAIFISSCGKKTTSGEPQKKDTVVSTPSDPEFPAERHIEELKQTVILSSLEQTITKDKNTIYSSVFLLCWQEVEKYYKGKVKYDTANSEEFIQLVNSKSFQNSLNENEYTKDVRFADGLEINGSFEKSLPFFKVFGKMEDFLQFQQDRVDAFGMSSYNSDEAGNIMILYYKNDDQFAISLKLQDEEHEMILATGLNSTDHLLGQVDLVKNWIKTGEKEKQNAKNDWKYTVNYEDKLIIPMLKFNLSSAFPSITNEKFKVNDSSHFVRKAYERIGFNLNEKGGKIEVEVYYATDSAIAEEMGEEPELPKPKNLIFDQPFLLMAKKKKESNPYLVLKIENTELMVIEK